MVSVIDVLMLSQVPKLGTNRLRNLIAHFETTEEIFSASAREIIHAEGFNKTLALATAHFLKSTSLHQARKYAQQQLSRVNKAGGRVITYWDNIYPEQLRTIYDPPPFLFMLGNLEENDMYSIGIVGTRQPTDYGVALAETFGREFARLGIVVVSGLARGIDTVAHSATLKHGGRTIAVIGSGVDVMYPRENKALSVHIARSGAVLSEYAMGAKPDAVNFPRRNRLISGLSLGTLVIETDVTGGAMITANMALDQNREVFAVPGNINSKRSRGCNMLIREGKAKLVENIQDILAELSNKLRPLLPDSVHRQQVPPKDLTLFEKNMYDALPGAPVHVDSIADTLNISPPDALANLSSLECKGLVRQLQGKMFVKL